MGTFDETQHPRSAVGTFTNKQNTAPAGGLVAPTPANTRYTLMVDGRPFNIREPDASGITVAGTLDGMPPIPSRSLSYLASGAPESTGSNWSIVAEVVDADGAALLSKSVPMPRQGNLLVLEDHDAYILLDDLDQRGQTLFDVDVHEDPLIEVPSDPSEPVWLDDVREWLSGGEDGHVQEVQLSRDPDDAFTSNIDIFVGSNLPAETSLTDEKLDENADIVEDVYRDWFDASIDVPDTWDCATVWLRARIDTARASRLLVFNEASHAYAKFLNETDRGTYGSPYVGTEIRRRIDERAASRQDSVPVNA